MTSSAHSTTISIVLCIADILRNATVSMGIPCMYHQAIALIGKSACGNVFIQCIVAAAGMVSDDMLREQGRRNWEEEAQRRYELEQQAEIDRERRVDVRTVSHCHFSKIAQKPSCCCRYNT